MDKEWEAQSWLALSRDGRGQVKGNREETAAVASRGGRTRDGSAETVAGGASAPVLTALGGIHHDYRLAA